MKTLRMLFAVTLVVTLLAASTAMAQSPTISVFFGPNQDSNSLAQTGTPFKIWVVLSHVNDSVNAVEYKLNLPPEVAIMDPGLYDGAIDVGNSVNGSAIGLGECIPVFDSMENYQTLVVNEMTALAVAPFASFNVTITEFTGSPQDPGTVPRYSNCNGQLGNLTAANGSLSASVATEAASWSAVKSLY